jgi:transcriptional regulator with XRE-family HTH domain
MELGQRIRKARKARGWNQAELAKRLQVSATTITRYESGERHPDPTTLKKLADLLEVSADYLLGRLEVMYHPDHEAIRSLPQRAQESLEDYMEYLQQKYGENRK